MTQPRTRNNASQFIDATSEIIIVEDTESFEDALVAAARAYVYAVNKQPGECWTVTIEKRG